VTPLTDAEATDEQREFLKPYVTPTGILNIYATMARNLKAARAFHGWGGYVLRQSRFDARLRELIILRIGWLCRSGYEWTQHSRLARREGMSDAQIEAIKVGASDPIWTDNERTLLRAADELHENKFITDATWAALGGFLDDEERTNVVFVVGHYTQVCMILNTFGIQVEDHQTLDESLRA
jgi:alkylhydroperoxidase family enzyme